MPDASACTAACRGEAMPGAVAVLRGLVAFQDRRLHHCSEEEMDKASRSAACGVHMHCHLHTWRKRASSVTLTNMHQSHRVEEHLPLLPRACTCCIDVQLVWCMKISCVFLQRRLYLRDPESWQEGSTSRSAYPTKYFMCCISPNHVIEYLATIG